MDPFIKLLSEAYPSLTFISSSRCYWSPETRTIAYTSGGQGHVDKWSVLHEIGHALLDHASYDSDVELLQKEMLAWEKARSLALEYDIPIDDEHIQDCLDSYREWLSRRSTCPNCHIKTLQTSSDSYQCFNCAQTWNVTPARHSRTYRRKTKTAPHE